MTQQEHAEIERLEAAAVQHEKNAGIIRGSMSSKPSPDDYEQLERIHIEQERAKDNRALAGYIRKQAEEREADCK